MATLIWLFNILKVALGLGFVIFLHELGHFLLAKWNGVKVEKFSIGFGPTLLGFKRGETEYVLAAIPLGGFVKMLGEGPDEEAAKSSDPRAYPNKSVGARMAIISAGVIMNLILGFACFVYAYQMGMEETPAKIGSVMAGAPAYSAGIKAGDEIVAMDGRRDLAFSNVFLKVRLSGQGQVIHFEIKRPGNDALIPLDIEPLRGATAEGPGVGINQSFGLILLGPPNEPYTSPAGLSKLPKPADLGFKPNDKVVAVGPVGKDPTPVADIQAYYRILSMERAEPLNIVVERETASKDGSPARLERVTIVAPPNRFVDFGFRLKIEPISGIRQGSAADLAGFRKGDRIVKVNGRDDFDPMRLPTICYENAGKPMAFEVDRTDPDGASKVLTLNARPDDTPPWTELAFPDEPLDVTGLGLAYPVRTKIESVTPGSPADKAGLKVGDVINAMVKPPEKGDKPDAKLTELKFDEKSPDWPRVFQEIQLIPRQPLSFRVNNSDVLVTLTPERDPTWHHPLRGLHFKILNRKTPPMTVASALRRGFDDTLDNIMSIYAMLRSLAQSRVSPKNLGGPIFISQLAFEMAKHGLTDLVHFLGILSINLAVLNFLPIPPLDGGQMVFLIAEKVRGRPLPDSALIAGTYVGLLLVLCLMVFVIFQDVSRLVTG